MDEGVGVNALDGAGRVPEAFRFDAEAFPDGQEEDRSDPFGRGQEGVTHGLPQAGGRFDPGGSDQLVQPGFDEFGPGLPVISVVHGSPMVSGNFQVKDLFIFLKQIFN